MRATSAALPWSVVLDWAGDVLTLADTDGLVVDDYTERVELFDPKASPGSARVTVWLPYAVSSRSAWLREATATLMQGPIVRLRGRVRQPEYGTVDEPVSFIIEADGNEDRALWPPADAMIDEVTWPDATASGAPYPFVFGKPSAVPVAVVVPASNRILIAGHRVAATAVRVVLVDGDGAETASSQSVTSRTDGRGRVVSTCDVTGAAGAASVYVDWSASLGGLVPDGGMGRCVEYLLDQSSVRWDRSAWASARDQLDAYTVDFYLDAASSPWEVARSALLSLAPVSVRSGLAGLYPIVWRVEPGPVLTALEQGRNCSRVGGIQEDDGKLATRYRMTYRRDYQGRPRATATAEAALSPFAGMDAPEIASQTVDREATARRALTWRAMAYAYPWRVLTYESDSDDVAGLVLGDAVSVTDVDFGLQAAYGHVVDLSWRDGATRVTVTLTGRR